MSDIKYRTPTISEVEKAQYIQLPKFIFSSAYKDVSSDAKILYTLLRNRWSLSLENEWYDEDGSIYVFFSREEMQFFLNKKERATRKVIEELKNTGLITEVRWGFNRPNKIYIHEPVIITKEQAEQFKMVSYKDEPPP